MHLDIPLESKRSIELGGKKSLYGSVIENKPQVLLMPVFLLQWYVQTALAQLKTTLTMLSPPQTIKGKFSYW